MKFKNHTISEKLGTPCWDQSGLFTPYHRKFNLHLIVNGIRRTFTYQYNPSQTKFEKGDGIYAVALDAECYMNSKSFEDFCNEFGYEKKSKGQKAYEGCRVAYEYLCGAGLSDDDIIGLLNKLNR